MDVIAEELNVRGSCAMNWCPTSTSRTRRLWGSTAKADLGAIDKHLSSAESDAAVARGLAPLQRGEPVTIADLNVTLAPEDVLIATERAGDWAAADEAGLQIALSTA
ncbi:MAG: hypothetical protein U0992_22915 [Planctomycetaceae bacterium]